MELDLDILGKLDARQLVGVILRYEVSVAILPVKCSWLFYCAG